MARTPLFGLLRRSLRAAHVSLRTGMEPNEILERTAERRVTRRSFLAASGTAAAGLAAVRCMPAARQLSGS